MERTAGLLILSRWLWILAILRGDAASARGGASWMRRSARSRSGGDMIISCLLLCPWEWE
jgi:hypothetical protein